MLFDPLSDVLSLLEPHTVVAGGLNLGGAWSLAFDAHVGIKCYALLSGRAWLAVEGLKKPLRLHGGDCVLLPRGRRFVLARDLRLVPQAFNQVPRADWMGGFAQVNGGGDTVMVAGHFALSGPYVDMLLGAMPSIIQLRDEDDKEGVRWALDRLRAELIGSQPGSGVVAQHLAHIVLIQALRLYMGQGGGRTVGWLFALADPRMARAISAIHAQPGGRWTVSSLAAEAAMSRSKFAHRFKVTIGSSPMDYLTKWRMLIACDRLLTGRLPLRVLAEELGYGSESAFSIAFKRVMGYSPGRHVELHAAKAVEVKT